MKSYKETRILYCSNRLFITRGYEATTMRQIAEAAGVSLGLATYHFKSKRQIAVKVMESYLIYLKRQLARCVSIEEEPLLHSASMVRLCIDFFTLFSCKRFYLECLQNEIYAESIGKLGNQGLGMIARTHAVDVSPDLLLLFDNFIPPNVERILLLEKEKGNFSGISFDEIPDIVFSVSVERYLDKKTIQQAADQSRRVVESVLKQIPKNITESLFAADIEEYVERNNVG